MLRTLKDKVSEALSRIDGTHLCWFALRCVRWGHVQDSLHEEEPRLFYCPACETVYIAIEKRRCSGCDSTVESVPATLQEANRS